MSTFVLVHGAWHGAWCWDLLVPELETRGHRAVAVDLPCDDVGADASRYADIVCEAIGDGSDDLVVVGHSLGGITIPLVAERIAVERLVFVCALVPSPGCSLVRLFEEEPEVHAVGFGGGLAADESERSYWADPALARATFYHDCPPSLAARAVSRLRPQARAPYRERCRLRGLPEVETLSIVCTGDRAVGVGWQRHTARHRLGVEAVELPGGHSPMLSRPVELAEVLTGS